MHLDVFNGDIHLSQFNLRIIKKKNVIVIACDVLLESWPSTCILCHLYLSARQK